MDIKFSGKSEIANEHIESDSILQGNVAGEDVVYLKHPRVKGHWIKVIPETVEQIR